VLEAEVAEKGAAIGVAASELLASVSCEEGKRVVLGGREGGCKVVW
jgi:hypothetical protein